MLSDFYARSDRRARGDTGPLPNSDVLSDRCRGMNQGPRRYPAGIEGLDSLHYLPPESVGPECREVEQPIENLRSPSNQSVGRPQHLKVFVHAGLEPVVEKAQEFTVPAPADQFQDVTSYFGRVPAGSQYH